MQRINAELNDNSSKKYMRLMTDTSQKNLRQFTDYEMIAEDIRLALTEKTIPASSSMTSVFDHSKEGKEQLDKVKTYIRKCLVDNQSPSEVIFSQITGK